MYDRHLPEKAGKLRPKVFQWQNVVRRIWRETEWKGKKSQAIVQHNLGILLLWTVTFRRIHCNTNLMKAIACILMILFRKTMDKNNVDSVWNIEQHPPAKDRCYADENGYCYWSNIDIVKNFALDKNLFSSRSTNGIIVMSHTAQYSHLVTNGWRRKLLPAGCSVVCVGSLLSYSCFNVDKVCKIFRIASINYLATGAAILHYAFAVQLCFPDSRTVCFPVHEFITTVQRTRSRLHTMERLYWGIVSAGKIWDLNHLLSLVTWHWYQ